MMSGESHTINLWKDGWSGENGKQAPIPQPGIMGSILFPTDLEKLKIFPMMKQNKILQPFGLQKSTPSPYRRLQAGSPHFPSWVLSAAATEVDNAGISIIRSSK